MAVEGRLERPSEISGQVVVVTGGGHGIGKDLALRLAQVGARVVIADVDPDACALCQQELTANGYEGLTVETDVTDMGSLEGMTASTIAAYGRIDVLINCAAIMATIPMSRVPFEEIDDDEWEAVMRVNLKGVWLACRAVVPEMRKHGYGKIVNMGSTTALSGSPGRVHYVASKAAIVGFSRSLSAEVAGDGIYVNCIVPGSTLSEEAPSAHVVARRESAVTGRSIRRVQEPADLFGAVLFFSSSASDFVTGQSLVVDGGAVYQ